MAASPSPTAATIARLACFAAAGVLSACFDPHYRMLRCSPARECPDHGQCGADGFCVDPSLPGPAADAAIDAAIDVEPPDAAVCFGGSFLTVCLQQRPAVPLVFASQTFDTSDPACMTTASVTSSADLCVLAGTTIAISGGLRVTGARPLVLVASDSISIEPAGTIDVSSHIGAVPEIGAGAAAACPGGTLPTVGNSTSGGGAGGTFAVNGGLGGLGGSTAPGAGGAPSVPQPLTGIRGGCPGQDGAGNQHGFGGHGGGAVSLIAGSSIDVSGTILAGGEGGGGGSVVSCGGGGGGSGGLIAFHAPRITGAGLVVAGGGGGGEGGGGQSSVGQPGSDGTTLVGAAGGKEAAPTGGDGGAGSVGASGTDGNSGGGPSGGGGGGGGGAGYIRSNVALGDIQVAPPATVVP